MALRAACSGIKLTDYTHAHESPYRASGETLEILIHHLTKSSLPSPSTYKTGRLDFRKRIQFQIDYPLNPPNQKSFLTRHASSYFLPAPMMSQSLCPHLSMKMLRPRPIHCLIPFEKPCTSSAPPALISPPSNRWASKGSAQENSRRNSGRRARPGRHSVLPARNCGRIWRCSWRIGSLGAGG